MHYINPGPFDPYTEHTRSRNMKATFRGYYTY